MRASVSQELTVISGNSASQVMLTIGHVVVHGVIRVVQFRNMRVVEFRVTYIMAAVRISRWL